MGRRRTMKSSGSQAFDVSRSQPIGSASPAAFRQRVATAPTSASAAHEKGRPEAAFRRAATFYGAGGVGVLKRCAVAPVTVPILAVSCT